MTVVVFRKYPEGDIIALFPEIAEDRQGYNCQCYQHVGQHGGADPQGVVSATTLATEEEYKPLKRELERIGYNVKVVKRMTRAHFEKRQRDARNEQASRLKHFSKLSSKGTHRGRRKNAPTACTGST